jgi:hypothetical protein
MRRATKLITAIVIFIGIIIATTVLIVYFLSTKLFSIPEKRN